MGHISRISVFEKGITVVAVTTRAVAGGRGTI
jgi:hypothetical protein